MCAGWADVAYAADLRRALPTVRYGSGLNRTAPRQGATGALKALIEGGYANGPGCDRLGQA